MKNIAIFGAGGFGREVKMLIDQINEDSKKFNFIGFYDDGIKAGTTPHEYLILGGLDKLNNVTDELGVVFAIADPQIKKRLIDKVDNKDIWFPTLIHPSVQIAHEKVEIGEGVIICNGVIVTVDLKIGDHVILNLGCTVGHDAKIGNFSSFMPSVNLSGEVDIHERVYIGTGAKVINQLTIGENTIVGAGAVVAKDLPSNCTAVGIPAKPIKFHDE